MGQLIDISLGGLAFTYVRLQTSQERELADIPDILMLFGSVESLRVEKSRVVYDFELGTSELVTSRRCGIQFGGFDHRFGHFNCLNSDSCDFPD